MKITAFVVFILLGARTFSLVFQGVGGKEWIEHLLTALPGGVTGFLIFVNMFVFILAFFLDFFEIAFIIIPLLAPVAEKLGIDLIWFGVLLGANMQTSFMHPPFGFALFYLRGIVSRAEVPSSDIYWGAIPWVFLQLMLCAILIFWPHGDLLPGQAADRRSEQDRDPDPTFGKDGGVGLVLPPLGSGFGQGPNIPVPTFPTLPTTGPDLGGAATKAPEATPTEPSAQTKTEEAPKAEEAKPEPKTEATPETTPK